MPYKAEWQENLELLIDFIIESKEHIENIDKKFLQLEERPEDDKLINDIFRSIHTVKGGAGMLNLHNMQKLAHKLETVLNIYRDHKKVSDLSGIETLLAGCDILNVLLAEVADKLEAQNFDLDPKNSTVDGMLDRVEILIVSLQGKTPENSSAPASEASEAEAPVVRLITKINFNKSFFDSCAAFHLLIEKKIKDNMWTEESQKQFSDQAIKLSFALDYVSKGDFDTDFIPIQSAVDELSKDETSHSETSLNRIFKLVEDLKEKVLKGWTPSPVESNEIENLSEIVGHLSKETMVDEPESKKIKTESAESKTIRIDQKLIDSLMNLVGEVIVARNSFEQILRNAQSDPSISPVLFKDLRDSTKNIVRISEDMQSNVMQMRMIPVKNLFSKFPRLVRDISKKVSKKVNLHLEGEHTDIDKAIAEDVADPLLHMVRNSVDHGIETPEERIRAGKDETGNITLRAYHEGNSIMIEVRDDGKGIDKNRILAKAIEKNLVSPEMANNLTEEQILKFIFAPGFSTAEKLTDISGRGVGMDVVNSNIKKLNGKTHISTVVGQGTVIKLELPLTMAVMDSLLVKVSSNIFAIPLEVVLETIKVKVSSLKTVAHKSLYSLRGEVITLEWLHELMDTPSHLHSSEKEITVLIIQHEKGKFGLVVDSIYRQEEIVVKALPDYLSSCSFVSGASVLGDGKTILILDMTKVLDLGQKQGTLDNNQQLAS